MNKPAASALLFIALAAMLMGALIWIGSSTSGRHVLDPFPTAKQVRLYVWVGTWGKRGEYNWNKPIGVILTGTQREKLESALYIQRAPEESTACFVPHHFFRYYDVNGEQIGEVSVCFECLGVASEGSGKLVAGKNEVLGADYDQIKRVIEDLDEPVYIDR